MAIESAAVRIRKQRDKPRIFLRPFCDDDERLSPEFELAFDIGVMAPLYGDRGDQQKLEEREFIQVNSRNFDQTMAQLRPMLNLEVEVAGESREVTFEFNQMADFCPDAVLDQLSRQLPEVAKLHQIREVLRAMRSQIETGGELEPVSETGTG